MIKFRYKRKEQAKEQTEVTKISAKNEKNLMKNDKIATIKRANSSSNILDSRDEEAEYQSAKMISVASCINAIVVRISRCY
jgi:hypothetical protein